MKRIVLTTAYIIGLIALLLVGFFHSPESAIQLRIINATFISGFYSLAVALGIHVHNLAFFKFVSYGAYSLNKMRDRFDDSEKMEMHEFVAERYGEKKLNALFYLIAFVLIAIAVIMTSVYYM